MAAAASASIIPHTSHDEFRPRHIAILIPTTSRMRPWRRPDETYLFIHTLSTFKATYNPAHTYGFYIGIDADDFIFGNRKNLEFFANFVAHELKNTTITFQYMKGIQKGHLTAMWNELFNTALADGFEYFYQTGDDIIFKTVGWVDACLAVMNRTNDIGLTGPINNNPRILTQSFVSKKHKEIFGFFFPPSIINWCCDDWINWVYQPGYWFPIKNHYCENAGGDPRYIINNDKQFVRDIALNTHKLRESTMALVVEHRPLVQQFISNESFGDHTKLIAPLAALAAASSAASIKTDNIIRSETLLKSILNASVRLSISSTDSGSTTSAAAASSTSSVQTATPPTGKISNSLMFTR